MTNYFPDPGKCNHYFGCVGYLYDAWHIGRWVALVLAWPPLYLLRVRPAWRVAVVGAVFLVGIRRFVAAAISFDEGPTPLLFGLAALAAFGGILAYALAAPVVTPRIGRPTRILIAAPLPPLYVIAALPLR